MSSYYGLIVSEYRHYDYEKNNINSNNKLLPTTNAILSQYDCSPPSYSAVLAEKYQQQQQCATWDQKLIELNDMSRTMRQSIVDTQVMMKSFQYCCQKLKFKNQSLLTELQQKIGSISEMNNDNTPRRTFNNNSAQPEIICQKNTNDSLTRMNQSLEKLIEEAETSLNTNLTLHADPHLLRRSRSCPRFTTRRNSTIRRKSSSSISIENAKEELYESERQAKLQQQKKRYFHSQWKLAIAMKQLAQTVQSTTHLDRKESFNTSVNNNTIPVVHHIHHHHHYHHHIYHHYGENKPIIEESIEKVEPPIMKKSNPVSSSSMMRRDSSSLTSLFKYALHTAGFIPVPQQPQPTVKLVTKLITNKVKIRTMFIATVLVLQKFNKTPIWVNRGKYLNTRWNQISKQQCQYWKRYANLLLLVIQLVALKT